jgi:hypothetical protein
MPHLASYAGAAVESVRMTLESAPTDSCDNAGLRCRCGRPHDRRPQQASYTPAGRRKATQNLLEPKTS